MGYAIRVLVQVQHLLPAKEEATEEEENKLDEEVFLSAAFNNKWLFERTLCRPVCRLPIVYRKMVEQQQNKNNNKNKKKQTKKPEVPQGELRTQVQSKITLQWAGVMSNLKCMMDAAKHI